MHSENRKYRPRTCHTRPGHKIGEEMERIDMEVTMADGAPHSCSERQTFREQEQQSQQGQICKTAPITNESQRGSSPTKRAKSLRSTIFRKSQNDLEPPKIVLTTNRWKACFNSTIHVLPLSISIFLIAVNCRSYFVGDPGAWTQLLQFAAKLHEISIQASIAAITLTYLRHELLGPGCLPFGAIFPAIQTSHLSSLWSSESRAMVASSVTCENWRVAKFTVVVVFSVLLAACVGPASAIAMLPRKTDFWYGSAETIFNTSKALFSPHSLDGQRVNSSCSTLEAMETLRSGACPASSWRQVLATQGGLSRIRNTNLVFSKQSQKSTIATTEPVLVANSLGWIPWVWLQRDIRSNSYHFTSVKAALDMPYVYSDCAYEKLADGMDVDFGVSVKYKKPGFTQEDVFEAVQGLSDQEGSLIWLEPDESDKYNVSILAIVISQAYRPTPTSGSNDSLRIASFCAVKARWIQSEFEVTISKSDATYNTVPPGTITPLTKNKVNAGWNSTSAQPAVSILPRWTQYLFPTTNITDSPLQVFINSSFYQDQMENLHNIGGSAQTFLSGMIATGMANTDPYPLPENFTRSRTSFYYDVPGYTSLSHVSYFFITRSYRFHRLQDSTAMLGSNISNSYLPDAFRVSSRLYLIGLAYSVDGVPIKIAISILGIYCMFSLLFLCYFVTTPASSTAWRSFSGIVTLALNSERPISMNNTSAGISTLKPLQQPVAIRAKPGIGLQLVFSEDKRDTDRILHVCVKNDVAY